ncbi:MAG: tetratricopeptide repeat protein [Bacteroides sp.]|nr:tetratricopeptide repeat protein [Bacteroidaceae bacterium]MBP3668423.1 tetratricopeptide repeat protein [Bacteroides sp.]MBQ8602600.1 tetratricopeptide repeat protein [Bacteroides sp.]
MKKYIYIVVLMCIGMQAYAQTYEELVGKAMDAVEADSLYDAEKFFKEALNKEPANMGNSLLLSNLGTIQRRMGKNKEALESYTLALNKSPHSVKILLNRASLYLELDYLEKAYSDYCNVIDLSPKNKEALQFRAYIYMRQRQYNEARNDYRMLLEEEPANKTARIGMVMANQKDGRYKEAFDELNRLVTDFPNDASLLKARAELEVEMNSLDLALLDLEEAVKKTPNDADIYVMCGDIYLMQGRKREAYVAFEKAIELGIPRPQLHDKLKASKK